MFPLLRPHALPLGLLRIPFNPLIAALSAIPSRPCTKLRASSSSPAWCSRSTPGSFMRRPLLAARKAARGPSSPSRSLAAAVSQFRGPHHG
jgi:hypothetical protein